MPGLTGQRHEAGVDDGRRRGRLTAAPAGADAMSNTINLPSPDRYSAFTFSKFTK